MSHFFGGKQAAVSLTFDDGLDVHFANVMPKLEQYGFHGTFYVNPGRAESEGPRDSSQLSGDDYHEKWARQVPHWQAAAARGHEVGNHTGAGSLVVVVMVLLLLLVVVVLGLCGGVLVGAESGQGRGTY